VAAVAGGVNGCRGYGRTPLKEAAMNRSADVLSLARAFLWANARLLERRRYSALFEGGSHERVLTALGAYQNEDGGFGNALEPDKRTSASQPIDQEFALRVLDEVGFESGLVEALCDFLVTITTDEGGVPFVLPNVKDAPRAPWWDTDGASPPAALNPTASIAALLHKHQHFHPWLGRATQFCWQKLEADTEHDVHTLLSVVLFLEHVPERGRAEAVFARLQEQVVKATALEPGAGGYLHPPYAFAPTPQSLAVRLYDEELMDAHLDALVASQQEDGGWPITWPAVSPGCELEYRGWATLAALRTLRAYRRL
jgi:hypothetical protein